MRWGRSWRLIVRRRCSLPAAAPTARKVAVAPAPAAEAPPPAAEDPAARLIAEADAHLAAGMASVRGRPPRRAPARSSTARSTSTSAPRAAPTRPAPRRGLPPHARGHPRCARSRPWPRATASRRAAAEPALHRRGRPTCPWPSSRPARRRARAPRRRSRTRRNDLPIELNDAVLTCIDLYQGRLRDWFEAALDARPAATCPTSARSSPRRASPRTSPTWPWWRAPSSPAPTRGPRPRESGSSSPPPASATACSRTGGWTSAATPRRPPAPPPRYLKELYAMFGDWNLAMAAYNAGEGKVQRGIDRYKTNDYWKLRKTQALRRETQELRPPDPRRDRRGQGAREVRLRRSRRAADRRSRRVPVEGARRPARDRGVRARPRSTTSSR